MGTEDVIKIDTSCLINFLWLTLSIFIITTILKVTLSRERHNVSNVSDLLFTFLKALGYGILALFIFNYFMKRELQEIDVLTFFTFMLAVFESGHNLSIFFGDLIKIKIDPLKSLTKKR